MSDPKLTGDKRIDELLECVRQVAVGKTISTSRWCEIVGFLEENLITDERILKEYEAGKALGVAQERNRIVKLIEDMACKFFLEDDHDRSHSMSELASRYRDLAHRIKTGK